MAIPGFGYYGSTLDKYIEWGSWVVALRHAEDCSTGFSRFTAYLDQISAKGDTVYAAPFAEVACYIKERNSATIGIVSQTADLIRLSVKDTMTPDSIYSVPVTVKIPRPSGWSTAHAQQAGNAMWCKLTDMHILADAIPDGGEVVISNQSVVILHNAKRNGDSRKIGAFLFISAMDRDAMPGTVYSLTGRRINHRCLHRGALYIKVQQ